VHPLFGEVDVVEQPNVGQPVQHPGAEVVGVTTLGQLAGKLGPSASPRGEQAQA
jgi:hypothetical protein